MSFSKTGAWSRKLTVEACHTQCDRCKHSDVPCLEFEGSDGEYGYLSVCRDCIRDLLDEISPSPVVEETEENSA